MYRAALRSSPSALRAVRPTALASGSRRLVSTGPATKKRSTWKGTGLRWGLAIAAVYFYNTSPIFADELPAQAGPAPPHFSDSDLPTIDAMIQEKRRQAAAAAPPPPAPKEPVKPAGEKTVTTEAAPTEETKLAEETKPAEEMKPAEETKSAETEAAPTHAAENAPEPGSPEALEQEAKQQGAFDPETGEINWDCPCLGGMADGPCGEEFKAAFSCFVYSKEEPKGMDCIDKFQHMQDCFRKYPEIYGSELADDDEEAPAGEAAEAPLAKSTETQQPAGEAAPAVVEAKKQAEEIIPKEATDATQANKVKKQ